MGWISKKTKSFDEKTNIKNKNQNYQPDSAFFGQFLIDYILIMDIKFIKYFDLKSKNEKF
jgi:hypothetical protein